MVARSGWQQLVGDWLNYCGSSITNLSEIGAMIKDVPNAKVIKENNNGCRIYDGGNARLVKPGDLIHVFDWNPDFAGCVRIRSFSNNGKVMTQIISSDSIKRL